MKFKKILSRYIMKYFLAFMIIYISNILLVNIAEKNVRNYILEKVKAEHQESLEVMDNILSKMEMIDKMILLDSDFSNTMYKKGLERSDVLKLVALNQKENEIGNLIDFSDYFFTVSRNNEMFVSNAQCYLDFSWYYSRLIEFGKEGVDLSDARAFKEYLFSEYVNGKGYVKFDKISYIENNRKREVSNAILFMESSSQIGHQPAYLTCFVLNPETMISQLGSKKLENIDFLCLIDKKNGESFLTYERVADGVPMDTEIVHLAESDPFVVQNENTNWILVSRIVPGYVEKQLEQVQFVMNIYLLTGILLVITLSLIFGYRNYKNIEQVIVALPNESTSLSTERRKRNEFQYVRKNIENMKQKNSENQLKINELISRNREIMLEHFLMNGVHSAFEMQRFHLNFGSAPEYYCVVIVRIMDKENLMADLVALRLLELLEQEYGNTWLHTHSGVTDELFLLEISEKEDPNVNGTKILFQEVISELIKQYETVIHVAISAIGNNIKNINHSYEQARQILEAQESDENVSRIDTYSIENNVAWQNPVDIDFLNCMSNLLKVGQCEEVCNMLKKTEKYYSKYPYRYELQKEQIYYSIRNILYSAWLSVDEKQAEVSLNAQNFDKNIRCEEMVDAFKEECLRITEYTENKKKGKNIELKDRIAAYIQENHSDCNLSVWSVSHAMGMSEKYLYSFLKEQMGVTFAAYLMDIRLKHAKELLENTDFSNAKIAEMTGFGSENTLYRNFKRFIGVTPKKYKESLGM